MDPQGRSRLSWEKKKFLLLPRIERWSSVTVRTVWYLRGTDFVVCTPAFHSFCFLVYSKAISRPGIKRVGFGGRVCSVLWETIFRVAQRNWLNLRKFSGIVLFFCFVIPIIFVKQYKLSNLSYFNTLYRASFIILYYDQQMHNYFKNYCWVYSE
jgi:hypothetical protein